MYKFGPVQQKLLLLLAGGVSLAFETSSVRYYRKLRLLWEGWKEIDQQSFNRSARRLVEQKLLVEKRLANGSYKLIFDKRWQTTSEPIDSLWTINSI
jgi:hypothetical protein